MLYVIILLCFRFLTEVGALQNKHHRHLKCLHGSSVLLALQVGEGDLEVNRTKVEVAGSIEEITTLKGCPNKTPIEALIVQEVMVEVAITRAAEVISAG